MYPLSRAALVALVGLSQVAVCQDDLGIRNGITNLTTSNFDLSIANDAQVLVSLRPTGDSFDFLPFDFLGDRSHNGQYHWGDLTYRYREKGSIAWVDGDSSKNRRPVHEIAASGTLASSNMGPSLPHGPLEVTRTWIEVEGDLALKFTIRNTGNSTIELGSLGFPADFNNIFTGRTPEETQARCSLSQPYIGMDAGQIRVNPIRGNGTALVVTALQDTHSAFEAYRFLPEPYFDETQYQTHSYEGNYEWQVLTKAWADKEWNGVEPWNSPSSMMLKPGDSEQFGLRFSLSRDGLRGIDDVVRKAKKPVVTSVPGYILPRDLPGKLFINADSDVKSIESHPAGALRVTKDEPGSYTVIPEDTFWGRARLRIEYADELVQTAHYYITEPTFQSLASMGNFLTTKAWFDDPTDPFLRTPSVMNYDHEEGHILEQDTRTYVAGLSDEAGSGAYLAAFMKQLIYPNVEEIELLDHFVDEVLWGHLQLEDSSVRKSMFFYQPDAVPDYQYKDSDWNGSWNKSSAYLVDRAYNYVHPSGAYWAMYRVSRAYTNITAHKPDWYISKAYQTIMRTVKDDISYNDLGLMGETVWGEILSDLKFEGLTEEANYLEEAMKARAEYWASESYPYGSEAPWDSTGQEGVYYWAKYFGLSRLADRTVDSVLGFMPNVPHWAWNGNAHRYWDFAIAGKIKNFERQVHHYASTLNSQVLLSAFRDNPSDTYLLRTGHGGSFGSLSNIHQDGWPSAAFHSFPELLQWDPYTSDYGQGFLGMSLAAGTYVIHDDDLGLVAYGATLDASDASVSVAPRDPARKRVFIGPLDVMVSIDAGYIETISFDEKSRFISVVVAQIPDGPTAKTTVLQVDSGDWQIQSPASSIKGVVGHWQIPFSSSGKVTIVLRDQ